MIKLVSTGVLVIALTCGAFHGYQLYISLPNVPASEGEGNSSKEVKTDFISVAVFRGGVVKGYLSFRAVLTLKDTDRLAEAGYFITDTIHRRLPAFCELISDPFDPKDAVELEKPLFAALSDKLGKDMIGSLKLADVAFDKRVE
jgi:hypothetical protein